MRLKGKIAVVTGGSQGIGEAIATRFAAEGATVALVYRSQDAKAEAVVTAIGAAGGTARAFKADLARLPEIDRMAADVLAAFGHVDILVNNAGLFRTVPVMEMTEAIWDETFDLNLKGVFFCCKALAPQMIARGDGRIINITSTAAFVALPALSAAYCASKAGLELLSKSLAAEIGKFGVNVNTIAPGNTATPLNAHLRQPGGEGEAYVALMKAMTPTGRAFLDPQEIAGPAVMLASDDAKGMHGATVMVDAGWTLW
jgi:NAD(P)-dependent dehydrogenase (short-subunit alcohol dehydrogenase family)